MILKNEIFVCICLMTIIIQSNSANYDRYCRRVETGENMEIFIGIGPLGWARQTDRQPRVEEDVSLIVSPVRVIQYYNKCNGRSIDNDDKREGIEMISTEDIQAKKAKQQQWRTCIMEMCIFVWSCIYVPSSSAASINTGQLHND